MEITLDDQMTVHPEGKIRLRDGRLLQGYTHKHMALSKCPHDSEEKPKGRFPFLKSKKKSKDTALELGRFFYEHAHFFLQHAETILSDSRMFLAPVPVNNNLAFMGTSKINHPTLGAYIEWWRQVSASTVVENGHRWLVWFIAGSPLSGNNRCSLVNEEGKIETRRLIPFYDVWCSFARINEPYRPILKDYATFTLEEVYALLKGEETDSAVKDCIFDNLRLRSANILLREQLIAKDAELKQLNEDLRQTRLLLHETALQEVYDKWCELLSEANKREKELLEARATWRTRLSAGEINHSEYEQAMAPIRNELKQIRTMDYPNLARQAEAKGLSIYDVIDYFKKKDESGEWLFNM